MNARRKRKMQGRQAYWDRRPSGAPAPEPEDHKPEDTFEAKLARKRRLRVRRAP